MDAPNKPRRFGSRSGQTMLEYAILYVGVIIPLTFGVIYLAEMLWVWHSVVDYTRDGARYASVHCYESSGQNVISYMQANVPLMIDADQFQSGLAQIVVNYYAEDGRLPAGRGHRQRHELSFHPVCEFYWLAARDDSGFPDLARHGEQRMRSGTAGVFPMRKRILCPSFY
jgi:hypothetical protein